MNALGKEPVMSSRTWPHKPLDLLKGYQSAAVVPSRQG